MRSRRIDSATLARFIHGYEGEQGTKLRSAIAEHFQVSVRTVENELPRLVGLGILEDEPLPGRGAPKAYRVATQFVETLATRKGLRRLIDLVRSGDMPSVEPPWLALVKELSGGDSHAADSVTFAFMQGWLAFCPDCLSVDFIWVEPLGKDLGPACSRHPAAWDDKAQAWTTRFMVSAWTLGLVKADETLPEARNAHPMGVIEHLREIKALRAAELGMKPVDPRPEQAEAARKMATEEDWRQLWATLDAMNYIVAEDADSVSTSDASKCNFKPQNGGSPLGPRDAL